MKDILNVMSEDIKEAEIILENFPITVDVHFKCTGDYVLSWNLSLKQIYFKTGDLNRRLIEHNIKNRNIGYEFLYGFIKFCLDEQAKILNPQEVFKNHECLQSLFKTLQK